jgi:alpha-galactosidase
MLASVLAAAVIAAASTAGCDFAAGVPGSGGAGSCASLTVSRPVPPPPVNQARPVLGFNPYNTFGTTISQSLIVGIVTAMARNGMRAAGYRYVILDDGWQGQRTPAGQLTADPVRFPCGMKMLAAFVHAAGFRFGLYTSAAPLACGGRPGSGGHQAADARTFAGWGVDYVKLDWCGADYSPAGAAAIATSWRLAMTHTKRPMILSINAGGDVSVGRWAHLIVNSWRVGSDICGSWYNQTRPPLPGARRCYTRVWDQGIYDYLTSAGLRKQEALAGPGRYLDPDMLEVGTTAESPGGQDLGTGALTPAEAGTNFAMWAMWSAPLIAGNDPRAMTGTDIASTIMLNRQLIAIDQDPLGRPAQLLASGGNSWQVWRKPMAAGKVAVAIVNLAASPRSASFGWATLGAARPPASVRDAWTGRLVRVPTAGLRMQVPSHGTAVYVLSPADGRSRLSGAVAQSALS